MVAPRYPVFVPSKGRAEQPFTARFLLRDGTPFRLVVEPSEEDAYRRGVPEADLLVTPRDEMRLLGVRNWIRDVAEAEGAARHWQLDDNIEGVWRWHQGRRLHCDSGTALAAMEDFADRYENVGIAGPNYVMFANGRVPPLRLNAHVYSATLVNHAMPCRWRLLYNDDTDLCLQALATGWATVQFNAFLIQKLATMAVRGGNTDDLYQGDGRLKMARSLERLWPGVVTTERRFQRPQHIVNWRKFDVALVRRSDLDWDAIAATEYPLELRRIRPAGARRSSRNTLKS